MPEQAGVPGFFKRNSKTSLLRMLYLTSIVCFSTVARCLFDALWNLVTTKSENTARQLFMVLEVCDLATFL
jgi:hypothetical protein